MGDRAMCKVQTPDGALYVYTHWGGHDLPRAARAALKAAGPRRGDHSYALRIVVDQLIAPGRDDTLGFGLLFTPNAEDEYNNDRPSVVVDLSDWTVTTIGHAESTAFEAGGV